jgi:hypothetical protein
VASVPCELSAHTWLDLSIWDLTLLLSKTTMAL